MMDRLDRRIDLHRLRIWLVASGVLGAAALFGTHPYPRWLVLILLGLGVAVVVQRPVLGLLALIPAALVGRMEVGTGTAVVINPATLLVPALLVVWVLYMALRRDFRLVPSRINSPLALFLVSGLLSLLIGTAMWDPGVPRSDNLIVVQLAQWAIFAFSAGAFWLTGNLVRDEIWLRRLTFLFLGIAGGLAILRVMPSTMGPVRDVTTFAIERSPFWLLVAALASGQLVFNKHLSSRWRVFLLACLGAVMSYVFFWEKATLSHWIGVATVILVLAWLRFPPLRVWAVVLLLVLIATGFLGSALYDFAGGEAEWDESGGSRLVLIERVIEVTMRNPIAGLGPAAYRSYAKMTALAYGRALWLEPSINSHNNYVDLFAHVGLVGLGVFFWLAVEIFALGFRVRSRFTTGFAAGYVNAMLAAWAGALVLMLFADWILPHVYNIGFSGFQASVLVWLFLGGLVALEQMAPDKLGELPANES